MTRPTVRLCQAGDETALSLVGQATFLEAFAGIIPGGNVVGHCLRQHAVGKYRAWLADPETRIWMAEIEPGAAPVGYLVLTKPDLPVADAGPGDAEVKRVYVLHRFQGAGIGAALMAEARRHAVAHGRRRLLLGVYSRNETAIRFYQKLGYTRVGERSFQVGDGTYHDFILGLALDPPAVAHSSDRLPIPSP